MSLQARLLLAIGYVLLVAIVAFEVPLAFNTSERIDSEVRAQADAQIDLLAVAAAEERAEGRRDLDPLAQVAAETVTGRVVMVDDRGRLIADSEGQPTGTDYSNRPEIRAALAGKRVQERRESTSLGMEIIATAAPMRAGDDIVGAVRITQSSAAEGRATRDSVVGLILIGLVVLAIGLAAAVVLARQLAGPVRNLTSSAGRIAAGELDARAPVEGSSEQRDLARSFNEMTDRLARALRSQREFVADASHQLRTPLTGVRLRLEEAQAICERAGARTGPERDAARELEAAMAELDRLTRIVEEMLVLSRAGESDTPVREMGLAAMVERALARWALSADEAGVSLEGDGRQGGLVLCPPGDADRVLDALIENALLYSPRGSTVRVAAAPGRVQVSDEGPGLDQGEEERVFERFHRGRAGRGGPKGSGLGLAIARGLARGWGGDVTLANRDGGAGTLATVTFADRAGRAGGPPLRS